MVIKCSKQTLTLKENLHLSSWLLYAAAHGLNGKHFYNKPYIMGEMGCI